ncbi:MAG: hypothetical protein WDO69_33880 [Pseudomonadota bacterium]
MNPIQLPARNYAVATDAHLVDPVRMARSSNLSNTVCLGLDLAWWGGKVQRGASCWDAIVGNEVGSLKPWHCRVDLRDSPTIAADQDPFVANWDADAELLVQEMRKQLSRLSNDGASRFLLAIDAPLATTKVGLSPRRKANEKNEKGGEFRSCDILVGNARAAIGTPWQRVMKVQPGAPLCPRVRCLFERVTAELGFTYWDGLTPFS